MGMSWAGVSMRAGIAALCLVALTVTAAWGQTPIRLVTYGAETAIPRWERIANAFHNDRPDYRLDVEIVPLGEYPTKISVMVAAGAPPDAFQTIAQWKVRWAEQGILKDLGPYWERSDVARSVDVFPFMMDAAMHQGTIVGVPWDFSSMAITVNVDDVNSAGLAVPDSNWTVQDYRDYAVRLARPDDGVYGSNLGAAGGTSNWLWSVNYTGQGWLNEDRNEVLVESTGNIEMLEYWRSLIELGAVPAPGTPLSRNQWTGGFGLWQGWVHWGERLGTDAVYDWAMVPYPRGPAGNDNFAHGHMWSMPINAESPERSWVFLEWLLSREGQRAIVEIDARQPLVSDPDLWEAFFSTVAPEKRQLMHELVIGTIYGQNRLHTMQYWATWPDVERVMNQHLGTVFRGESPAASAMASAASQIRAILNE